MPDGRMLSKSIAHSDQLAMVSLDADYLFTRCLPHLDREGRMHGHPNLVKSIACPLRIEITVEGIPDLLRQLAGAGLVLWFECDGKQVLEFPGFKNHQKGARFDREAESRLPASTSSGSLDILRTNSGPTPAKVRVSEVKLSEGEVKLSEVEAEPRATLAPVEEITAPAPTATTADGDGGHRLECEAFVKDAGYGARERLIAQGEDSTAWNTPDGSRVPWDDRLRLLKLADARVKDRQSDNLRSALRYVVPQQYDPTQAPTSKEFASNRPVPGTEHDRIRSNRSNEDPGQSRAFRREGTGLATLPELVQANLRKTAEKKAGAGATQDDVDRVLTDLVDEYDRHHRAQSVA